MFFTHLFDLIAKVLTLAIAALVIVGLDGLVSHDNFNLLFLPLMVIPVLVWWLLLRPLSSWCYARYRLGVRLSFRQADQASALFSPVVNFTRWTSLTHLRTLDEAVRTEALLDAVDEVRDYYEGRRQEWRAAPLYAKALRAAFWLSMPYLIYATKHSWWPFDWLVRLENHFFGESYSLLNMLILWILMAVALFGMERNLGIRSIDIETERRRAAERQ